MHSILITQRSAIPDHAATFVCNWDHGVMAKLNPFRRHPPVAKLTTLVVRPRAVPNAPHLARLHAGQTTILAAIGKAGVRRVKREGDGGTPVGRFGLMAVLFRPDRVRRMWLAAGSRQLDPGMGWGDDATSSLYNRPAPAGSPFSHERLWRDDGVYDVVIPTTHNQRPRIRGAGSAIFLHLARPGYLPTEGCVAISLADLRRLLPRLGRDVRLIIAR